MKKGRTITFVVAVILVASLCGPAALSASRSNSLAGKWSGSYTGGYAGTFTIHWTQARSKLNGTIALSNPKGTYTITGSVNGTGIKFGAVGVGAVYSGSVSSSGRSMSGHWTSGPARGTWKAHKA